MVDLGPPLGTGNGTVTGEGPDTSRGSGGAADTADDSEDHEGEDQAKGTAGGANGALDDGGHGLGAADELGDVGKHEDQGDEEEETGKGVDEDGSDHGLGDLGGRLLNLLAHAGTVLVQVVYVMMN